PLLLGKSGRGGSARQAGHHLVWSLFADGPDRRRDFLWREMEGGTFFILSVRPPEDHHGLFEIAEPKPFVPAIESGDRLSFTLRANPIVRRRVSGRRRSVKHDVVMDALRSHASGDRDEPRVAAVHREGLAWLERQGVPSGFAVEPNSVRVDGYQQHRIGRSGAAGSMSYSTLDFEGVLTVRDPGALLPAIARGFGASKAYGCGLMLIRRA
ncbi:MAG: type I-E CRISPR-associated protein Cas6/Cse3/CasE, partial [Spirochaetaceae bacterium]|nr:type I-E CRISPR-associated protein Cas6/Cse3/CasE [Spirochaetaceae bacterium]